MTSRGCMQQNPVSVKPRTNNLDSLKKKKKRQRKDKTKKQKGKEPGGKTYEPYQQNASMDSDSNKPRTNERRTKPGQLEPVVTIL